MDTWVPAPEGLDRLGRRLNIRILSGSLSDSEAWPRLGNQEKKLSLDMSLLVNAFRLKAFSFLCSGSSLTYRKASLPGLSILKDDVREMPSGLQRKNMVLDFRG